MSSFRITQHSIGMRTLAGLQGNLSRLGEIQQQLSSGKLISKPSDSPTGTVSAMQFRSEIRTNEQWARNADDGLGWLNTMDSKLTNALVPLNRAGTLTLQGLNSGATSPAAREALAGEIDQIREGLINEANTTYLGRPVFGGTTGGAKAYDTTGAYVGAAATVVAGATVGIARTVGTDAAVRIDQTGPEVFGTFDAATPPSPGNMFQILTDISANLRSGNTTALSGNLDSLQTATNRVITKAGEIGARTNRIEQMQSAANDRVLSLTNSLSAVEDIDLPKTIVALQMQDVAYKAALGATQKIITPSLADFLR